MKFEISAVLAVIVPLSLQISLPSSPYYKAGVVEFAPTQFGTPKENYRDNVQRIVNIITSSNATDLDIIVFPEYVVNNMQWKTFVPDPKLRISPCEIPHYDLRLAQLSCAARSQKVYVVVNMLEKYECTRADTNCGTPGLKTYNTNIVFDRNGRIISRYRKTHLYGDEWYNTNVTKAFELASFTTDFGVTFGHFICFDMMFYTPSMVLVNELKITDIIYPTYWFSELPFLTAVQLQEGWAYGNNVNLLAADSSLPSEKNTGSGIYAGKLGRLTATIHEEPTVKLLVADVPKKGFKQELPPKVLPNFEPQLETPRLSKISLLRDYNVDIFQTKLLEENFTYTNDIVCHQSFCCSFKIERTFIQESSRHSAYRYRIAAYSGNETTFQRRDKSDISVCAVIACTNNQLFSCGFIFPENTLVGNKYYFKSIAINGKFRKSTKRLIMPSTVDGGIMPLSTSLYEMTSLERANQTEVSLNLIYPKSDILTFGMWANYYLDIRNPHNLYFGDEHIGSNSNGSSRLSQNLVLKILILIIFYYHKGLF